MKHRLMTIAAMVAGVSVAGAQDPGTPRLELRPFAGWYLPTGAQADDFKSTTMFGMQVAGELTQHVHLLGSFGWTDGRSKIPALSHESADILQFDAGAEFNALQEVPYGWLFRPFIGVGAGARRYEYQATGVGNRTCAAGYAALGTEFQKGPIALRLESRGYVHCFKSPLTDESRNRSDAMFALGFAYHVF